MTSDRTVFVSDLAICLGHPNYLKAGDINRSTRLREIGDYLTTRRGSQRVVAPLPPGEAPRGLLAPLPLGEAQRGWWHHYHQGRLREGGSATVLLRLN